VDICVDSIQLLAPGIVSLRAYGQAGPLLTMKPGSYLWPDAVWALISQGS